MVAARDTGVCRVGEPGVCYEVYRIGDRPGWSFVFANGGYDRFRPDEVATMLHVTGRLAEDVAGYAFRSVAHLARDYEAGRFARAFALCRVGAEGRA